MMLLMGFRIASQSFHKFEPREHGAASPVFHIHEAIEDVQASAAALAAVFAVDLARAHQARLEALLGAPLPTSLVREGKQSLGTWRLVVPQGCCSPWDACHAGWCASPGAFPSSSTMALASCRSAVSKPSVNQP